ncbi:F0F1 ATP synthase subunit beta, partial [Patescibacteria group bacterium]|nr:F0F1 ATP synthase subunit beta [Patescibacteria group bacterium]
MLTGKISQIIGVVVDVQFETELPNLFNALETKMPNGDVLVLEVQQHLGSNAVRTVAMSTTDGLERGQEVTDSGAPITVPVGPGTLGRMYNVVGKPIDGLGESKTTKSYPIHRPAPEFTKQSTKSEVLETGIKVIDLICP